MIYDASEMVLEKTKTGNKNEEPSSATELNKHTACDLLSFVQLVVSLVLTARPYFRPI